MISLRRALELAPDDVDAHDCLGVGYFKLGDRVKALEELAIVDRLQPGFDCDLRKLLTESTA